MLGQLLVIGHGAQSAHLVHGVFLLKVATLHYKKSDSFKAPLSAAFMLIEVIYKKTEKVARQNQLLLCT